MKTGLRQDPLMREEAASLERLFEAGLEFYEDRKGQPVAKRVTRGNVWSLDELDVVVDGPSQALIALMNARYSRVEQIARINGRPMYFGEVLVAAARAHGSSRAAERFERLLRARLGGSEVSR